MRADDTLPAPELESTVTRAGLPAVGEQELGVEAMRRRLTERMFGEVERPLYVGRFRLSATLGSGGMGVVYLGEDDKLGRRVAIKVVHRRDLAGHGSELQRMLREARSLARLSHPNIVQIYEVDERDGELFIVMEYVRGVTLHEWLAERSRRYDEVVAMFLAVGRGLAAAHAAGIVHRDVKPNNAIVGEDRRVRLIDFGLAIGAASSSAVAQRTDRLATMGLADSAGAPTVAASARGEGIAGTPAYMSPEHWSGENVTAASDQFSFCVALYEGLYGHRPFVGPTPHALMEECRAGRLAIPRATNVPARLFRVLARGLSANPAQRYPSTEALLSALERAAARLWPRLVGIGALISAALAGGVLLGSSPALVDPCAASGAALTDTWNDEKRAALAEAFTTTGLVYARETADRVITRLDRFAADWTAARVDACEASEIHRDQSPQLFDARIACLGRRELALRALVDRFTAADPATVAGALEAVTRLPELDLCSDAEQLARAVPPPDDRATAEVVAEVRAQLARSRAEETTGHPRVALELAQAAVARAALTAYSPVQAEALHQRSRLLGQFDAVERAEQGLLDAAELAEASRHDEIAADVWLSLLNLARDGLHDHRRGDLYMRRARAAQRRLGDPASRRSRFLLELTGLHVNSGRLAEAERTASEAIDLLERGLADDFVLGAVLHHMANILDLRGRPTQAAESYERALAVRERTHGPHHPALADLALDMATFHMKAGEYDFARERLDEALSVYSEAYGLEHHLVGQTHLALMELEWLEGALAASEYHAVRAHEVFRAALPADHPALVQSHCALGMILFVRGDYTGARRHYREAQQIVAATAPDGHVEHGQMAINLADTSLALDRLDEAATHYEEAERIARAENSVTHRDVLSRALRGRGQLLLARGRAAAALALLEQASDLRGDLPEDPVELASLRDALGQARRRLP